MSQVSYNEIFEAIKSDNLILFSKLIKNNEKLSFGRFPLLSLCYLYNSKNIINEFRDKLMWLSEYNFVEENIEIYKKFRAVAGKGLRLYVKEGSVVSPLEMIAILHKDNSLRRFYNGKKGKKVSKKIQENIQKIYVLNGQEVDINEYGIKVHSRRLGVREKRHYKIGLSVALIAIFVLSAMFSVCGFAFGFGTENNPIKIFNQLQFERALNSNDSFVLSKDITINKSFPDIKFEGTLNGDGHSIFINNISDSLIKTNGGTIKNLKIKYPNINREIDSSLSLLCINNNGTIDNVNVECGDLKLTCNKSQEAELYIAGIAVNNNGKINNSMLNMKSGSIVATGSGECFVGGICGNNYGDIENCSMFSDNNLETNEVDVSGICVVNNYGGNVVGCINRLAIIQVSEIKEWSPTVAGIVLSNYGIIDGSKNFGDLKVDSRCEQETVMGNIFLGGISAYNYGSIISSINKGNLTATAKSLIIYCGGISAYSSYWVKDQVMILPSIENCGTRGEMDLLTEDENAFIFAGGISGYLYGKVVDSYSLMTFTSGYTEEKNFIGTLLGSAYVQYQIFTGNTIYLEVSNCYVLVSDVVDYYIGALINSGSIVSVGIDLNDGVSTCLTTDEIEGVEIYFDEE